MADLLPLMFFPETIFFALCISSPEFSSDMGSAAAARGEWTSSSDMFAVKFKTGFGRAATRLQARVSQSRIEKGGLPLGFRPNKKKRCKLEAVKKRHELETIRKFSISHVCNGSSALVVPNVKIRRNQRTKR